MFMLLFRYVFGGAIETGGTTYVNFLVAGILVQTVGFGSTMTAIAVATDLQKVLLIASVSADDGFGSAYRAHGV